MAAACTLTAGASGIDDAAAFPRCALSAAGRFGAAFVRATAFSGATTGYDFLASLVWVARFRPGFVRGGEKGCHSRRFRTEPGSQCFVAGSGGERAALPPPMAADLTAPSAGTRYTLYTSF